MFQVVPSVPAPPKLPRGVRGQPRPGRALWQTVRIYIDGLTPTQSVSGGGAGGVLCDVGVVGCAPLPGRSVALPACGRALRRVMRCAFAPNNNFGC